MWHSTLPNMIPAKGVYALTHIQTKSIYIGSSINLAHRRQRWWQTMKRNPQNLQPNIRALSCNPRDWTFTILWDGTNATSEELEAQERRAVVLLWAKRSSCLLNIIPVQRSDNLSGFTAGGRTMSINAWSRLTGIPRATIALRIQRLGWPPEQCVGLVERPPRDYKLSVSREQALGMMGTIIFDDSGNPMLISEAAVVLGCRSDTLARRLANRRGGRNDRGSITLAELRAGSEKYCHWQPDKLS